MDMQSAPIPVTTGFMGDRPQISLIPWFYFPLATAASGHPVVRNINAVRTEFVSSIDTVAAAGIEKTILLQSSPYSRLVQTPARISFDIMQTPPDENLYREGSKHIAVLLEGEFTSVFTNRRNPIDSLPAGFERREKGVKTAMIVVADGDLVRNQFDNQGEPLPLGYDRFLDETFGNAEFILNAINYLNDDRGIMDSRSRDIRLRLLDKNRITNDKVFIQMVNVTLPVLLLLIFGLVRFFLRQKKYSTKHQ
jgi:ABC-2 type transport system permease protein